MSALNTAVPQPNAPRKLEVRAHVSVPQTENAPARILLNEDAFVSMLYLERRRAERTQKRFVLVLMDVSRVLSDGQKIRTIQKLAAGLSSDTRETDIIGWYVENSLIGIIGTEVGEASQKVIQERFISKLREVTEQALGKEKAATISVSFHFFPEEIEEGDKDHSANIALYPEFSRREERKRFSLSIKRAIDVFGSSAALFFFSPFFAAIAIAIKLTSKGPVLFRQERLGQHGKTFTVLKFRSMRTDCDSKIHEAYVSQFIAGKADNAAAGADSNKAVYKLQRDPRITAVGHFLRKTSLDELPQFWNIVIGDMSLIGPRPIVDAEIEKYGKCFELYIQARPGLTGLWQVSGRSDTSYQRRVELDQDYLLHRSLRLDLLILVKTVYVVIGRKGAY